MVNVQSSSCARKQIHVENDINTSILKAMGKHAQLCSEKAFICSGSLIILRDN